MAVLIEAISVIVPLATLERAYPGGVRGYAADCPNATFVLDHYVTRVAFMTPADVGQFVERLKSAGLTFEQGGECVDVAVVDERHGPTVQCSWLAFDRTPEGHARCWLAGADPGDLAVPASWLPERAEQLRYVPLNEIDERVEHIASDASGLETYRLRETGETVYLGRAFPFVTEEDEDEEFPYP